MKDLLIDTSNGWTLIVHPDGAFKKTVFLWLRRLFHSRCCALGTFASRIFPLDSGVAGLKSILPRHFLFQHFITVSSHQAFSWNETFTRLSQVLFSSSDIRKPFSLKIKDDLNRQNPSSKTVNWTVHCR